MTASDHGFAELAEVCASQVRAARSARRATESYETWFGEGAELPVLRMLGLFDRPVDEKTLGILLEPPAIRGLTASLTHLTPAEWRTILAKLRRARLLAGEDPHNPGHLDTHPLVREYFGEQLRSERTEAWKECNRRLYEYYRALAPQLPDNFREMEPLFLAVVCACNVGLYREALHEIYTPRIQRGKACFAANALGARGALLSVLVHFFEQGRWGSPVETGIEEQNLNAEDQLFVLMQAALYLTATRGLASTEAKVCYERAESLCHSLNRPLLLYSTLFSQWRYSFVTEKVTATLQIAERIYSLAQNQDDPAPIMAACTALAATHCYLGDDFQAARQYALRGVEIWRSGGIQTLIEEQMASPVVSLIYEALSEWYLGEAASSQTSITKAISLAKELNDMSSLAFALYFGGILARFERNPAEVERLALELIELATRYNFSFWLPGATVLRGWAHTVSGDTPEGISLIEQGVEDYRATGSIAGLPMWIALKAEALYLAGRTSEALETAREAQELTERFEVGWWYAELRRLRGVFLAATGGDEPQIETSFCEAIRIARDQKAISVEKRTEASYAEYRRQKASALGGQEIRLPL